MQRDGYRYLGSHNMIFTTQNNAWKNVAMIGLFLGSDKGLKSPICVLKAPLG